MLLGQHALLESFLTLASLHTRVKLLGYFVLLTWSASFFLSGVAFY